MADKAEEFTAGEVGVSEGAGAPGVSEETPAVDAPGDAQPVVQAEGTTDASSPSEHVPITQLRELQSVKDREIAEMRAAAEAERAQLIELFQRAQAELDQYKYANDPDGLAKAQTERQQAMAAMVVRQQMIEVENRARAIVIAELASRYGVKREEIARFGRPEDMEAYAQAMSNARRSTELAKRAASKADAVEGGAVSPAKPLKDVMDDLKLFNLGYKNSPRRR